jgi:hypothetical protein
MLQSCYYQSDLLLMLVLRCYRSTAVAHGAVLRAANKVDGPERRVRSSYGIYWTERYEPTVWEAHATANPWYDPVDGNWYIKKTIDWVVNKVCVGTHLRFAPFS